MVPIPDWVLANYDEEEKKQADIEKNEKKQRELAYISQFLTEDIGFTHEDKEQLQEEVQAEQESKVSRAVKHHSTVIRKKTQVI